MWYNPASWLMRRELRNVHEYQADNSVLAGGADTRSYQMLLIEKAAGVRLQSLANSLDPCHERDEADYACESPCGHEGCACGVYP